MPALTLTLAHRRDLRALSHGIRPVVWIGASGLSESVIRELDLALKSRELIKIRVAEAERETREAMLEEICQRLGAAPVRHIGRILVIYRPDLNEQRIKEDSRKNSRGKNDEQLKG
jgi:putative YhbY family RNA-binding protein